MTDHQLRMVWLGDRFTSYGPFILAQPLKGFSSTKPLVLTQNPFQNTLTCRASGIDTILTAI